MNKTPVKVIENSALVDIAPLTRADAVYSNDGATGTVRSELDELAQDLDDAKTKAEEATILVISPTQPNAPTQNMIWVKPL